MARCRVCGAPAVVCYPDSRLCLCRDHFLEHFESKVERVVEKFKLIRRGGLVLAAVSGGKDSAALLAVLSKLSPRLGFRVAAVHIDLGIGEYSRASREAAVELARTLGVPIVVIDLREVLGAGIPELAAKARRPPCSVCGLVKRFILNAAGVEACADAIAMGHNADDVMVYAVKSFMTQDLEAIPKLGPSTETVPGLAVGRIRPLYTVSEKESFLYSYLRGLPVNHDECPHVSGRQLEIMLKERIASLESRRPGLRAQLVSKLARRLQDYPRQPGEAVPCRYCGLMSWGGECSFCRLTRRVLGEPLGGRVREYIRGKLEEAGVRACSGGIPGSPQ